VKKMKKLLLYTGLAVFVVLALLKLFKVDTIVDAGLASTIVALLYLLKEKI